MFLAPGKEGVHSDRTYLWFPSNLTVKLHSFNILPAFGPLVKFVNITLNSLSNGFSNTKPSALEYNVLRFCNGAIVLIIDSSVFDKFADKAAVSEYAKNAMIWATDAGLIRGAGDGMLMPNGNATRAQVAVILKNYYAQRAD